MTLRLISFLALPYKSYGKARNEINNISLYLEELWHNDPKLAKKLEKSIFNLLMIVD